MKKEIRKTNHINYVDTDGQVYCFRKDSVVQLNSNQWKFCAKCPYLNGTAQGDGVECLYADGSNEDFISFDDSAESDDYNTQWREKLSKDSKGK